MKVIFYPDSADIVHSEIHKFADDLRISNPILWTMSYRTINKVKRSSSINDLLTSGWVERMPHTTFPIWEFRIPPQKKSGVVRLYFAYKKTEPNTIIILTAELKHKTKPNKDIIKLAEQRYKEVCK